jgi:8-oxo-dGTP diphosphatase
MRAAVPEFGNRVAGQTYKVRPGAYGIITNEVKQLATIRPLTGGYFLPGGGIEAGENPEDALTREILEECGWTVRLIERVGEAVQYLFAAGEGHLAVRATFYRAAVVNVLRPSAEGSVDQIVWLDLSAAMHQLRRQSDTWAVTQVLPLL